MANTQQYAMMCARQEEEYQELRKVIKYMNKRQGRLPAMAGRERDLVSETPEDLW